jgi:dUTP pyrophosphatase
MASDFQFVFVVGTSKEAQEKLLPRRATPNASGFDLASASVEPLVLRKGQRALVPTGIAIAIPFGYEAQVRPRSGLAAKNGITVLNAPGTIDSDYRGEIKVILINHGDADFVIEFGMRIAQLVIARVHMNELVMVQELSITQRGEQGFGSSGLH